MMQLADIPASKAGSLEVRALSSVLTKARVAQLAEAPSSELG